MWTANQSIQILQIFKKSVDQFSSQMIVLILSFIFLFWDEFIPKTSSME